jgi:hypothetical protein
VLLKRKSALGKLNCKGKLFKAECRDMENRLRRVLGPNFGATISGNFCPILTLIGKRAYAAALT